MSGIKIFPNIQALVDSAVEQFIALARKSVHECGNFYVALSGGSTPQPLYQALGESGNQARLPWEGIHLFWGDERHVRPDHPDSNFRMVKEHLLDLVAIPEENIHRVPAEMEARLAAFSYEEKLRQIFKSEWPRFDLVYLGMGEDGHTASLFPHSAGLNEEYRWFIANYAPKGEMWRLTLSKNAINAALNIVILVQGNSKAKVLFDVLCGVKNPHEKPIQLISPIDGKMTWLVDKEAASQLPEDF